MNNDYIKFHTLGIMAHSKKSSDKTTYELPPIDKWTEEFCETINQINYDKKIKFSISSSDKLNSNVDEKTQKIFEAFSHIAKVENIYIFNSLPDNINYVRFTDCVILREDNPEFATQCANSIMAGLSLIQTFNAKRDKILKEKTESLKTDKKEAEKQCNLIRKICALQAHFTADNKRSIIGSDNYIFNELLQNANDRISDGIMNISIKGNELILSYNEDGFSAKDFLAISTSGNSGNIDNENRNNDNMNATGHKGTGFKSVYNVFEKVVIQSGFVKCTLDDSKKINCSFEGDKIKQIICEDWKMPDKKRYFPVPKFEFLDQCEEKTNITLTFIEDRKTSFIESNNLESKEKFEESKVYCFLDNIEKFEINGNSFNKNKYLEDNFYKYEEEIKIDETELENNPRWKYKDVKKLSDSQKNKITILFPKENPPKKTSIYCTLPVANEELDVPFYINCPVFELEDGRNSISNNDNIKKWNECIWENAIKCSESAFSKIFNNFAEEHSNIAYKYFPYEYIDKWQCLKKISFIRTITGNADSYKLMTWKQWYRELPNNHQAASKEEYKKGFVFLPDYMYEWFKGKKGLDGFSCDIPFVYYDYEFGYNNFRNEKLHEEEYVKKIIMELFQNDDKSLGKILLDIEDFFFSKYYVERKEVIQGEFEIEFLKKLYNTNYFDSNLQKQYCYQWYLGKTICESPAHSIERIGISIDEYKCIFQYKEEMEKHFGGINEESFTKCFKNLRTKLYFDGDRKIVNEKDIFLNSFLQKFKQKSEEIHFFSNELDDSLINELDDNELEDNRKNLFESGKIGVKRGNGSFCLSDNVNDLFTSSVIDDEKFILEKPEWAKKYVEDLDERLIESEFYRDKDWLFFKDGNMLQKYLEEYDKCKDVIKAIDLHIKNCDEISPKEMNLFELICKFYLKEPPIMLDWDKKYLEMIDKYKKPKKTDENKIEFNSQIKLCFNDEKLRSISPDIVDGFNDRVDQNDKEKRFKFLDENEELSLKEIFEKKVSICNDKYNNNRRYCIGTKNGDKNEPQDIIIVFGEESVGTMLSDLFDCKSYINPSSYNSMDCHLPNPLFKPDYDNWNDLNFNEIPEIKYSDDKELKNILIQRFEFKLEDKWLCFKGYGGDVFEGKHCPLCGGVMIAEASSLRIRYIKAIKGIHVPILICSSCDEAVKYTENIYFCDEERKQYLLEDNSESKDRLIELLKSNEKISICFDMFSNEKKIFLLDMTLFHRLICLKTLKERKP